MTTDNSSSEQTRKPSNVYRAAKEVLEGHYELAKLEWSYEQKFLARAILGLGLCLFCLCLVLFSIQLALVGLLIRLGIHLGWIGLSGAVLNTCLAIAFFKILTRRDTDMKKPFEKTRSQLKRTLEWIETLI